MYQGKEHGIVFFFNLWTALSLDPNTDANAPLWYFGENSVVDSDGAPTPVKWTDLSDLFDVEDRFVACLLGSLEC